MMATACVDRPLSLSPTHPQNVYISCTCVAVHTSTLFFSRFSGPGGRLQTHACMTQQHLPLLSFADRGESWRRVSLPLSDALAAAAIARKRPPPQPEPRLSETMLQARRWTSAAKDMALALAEQDGDTSAMTIGTGFNAAADAAAMHLRTWRARALEREGERCGKEPSSALQSPTALQPTAELRRLEPAKGAVAMQRLCIDSSGVMLRIEDRHAAAQGAGGAACLFTNTAPAPRMHAKAPSVGTAPALRMPC